MQHPQDDDAQLRGLLREWKAPETPASLEQRVLGSRGPREPWWRFLFNGYIRVPVPVACALVALLTFAAWRVADQPPDLACPKEPLRQRLEDRNLYPQIAASIPLPASAETDPLKI